MRVPRVLTAFIVCAAGAILLAAQQPRSSGAASGASVEAGRAVLSGLLTTPGPAREPVRRATMRLTGDTKTAARLIGTDDEGKFVFDALPAGSYTLSASKPGFVTSFYGSKHPGRGPGVPIAIGPGARIQVALEMLHGAAIAGLITDVRGAPAPGVPVLATELRAAGVAPAAPVRAVSDDRGMYRLFGLAPGDYVISATPQLATNAQGRSGMTPEIAATTEAEVQWARAASAGATTSAVPAAGAMPPGGRLTAYAPVYYPGTTDARSAGKVTVAAGEERSNVSLSLRTVSMARIGGSIVDGNGRPVMQATVFLAPRIASGTADVEALVRSGVITLPRTSTSSDRFSLPGVAPGDYTLVATSGGNRGGRGAAPSGDALWSITNLSVDGRDQTDLLLRLLPGQTVTGSIAFESTSPARTGDVSNIGLSLEPALTNWDALAALRFVSTPHAAIDRSGAFTFSSVVPGAYTLIGTARSSSDPTAIPWSLRSAMLESRDLSDGVFDVKSGVDLQNVRVTFTDRPSSVSGRLVDAAGQSATHASVVVFTTDRTLWLPNARRIQSAQPATDGSFTISGLPPGEYAIAAAVDLEPADLGDPVVLAQLLAAGYRVTLAAGEEKRQDLRVGN